MNPRRVSGVNPVPFALIPEFSELVTDFKFSRPEIPVFEVLPLPETLAPLDPLDCPLNFPLFSLLVPLPVIEGSLLDHDLLSLPLPDDCLPVFLLALQSRSTALQTPIART